MKRAYGFILAGALAATAGCGIAMTRLTPVGETRVQTAMDLVHFGEAREAEAILKNRDLWDKALGRYAPDARSARMKGREFVAEKRREHEEFLVAFHLPEGAHDQAAAALIVDLDGDGIEERIVGFTTRASGKADVAEVSRWGRYGELHLAVLVREGDDWRRKEILPLGAGYGPPRLEPKTVGEKNAVLISIHAAAEEDALVKALLVGSPGRFEFAALAGGPFGGMRMLGGYKTAADERSFEFSDDMATLTVLSRRATAAGSGSPAIPPRKAAAVESVATYAWNGTTYAAASEKTQTIYRK